MPSKIGSPAGTPSSEHENTQAQCTSKAGEIEGVGFEPGHERCNKLVQNTSSKLNSSDQVQQIHKLFISQLPSMMKLKKHSVEPMKDGLYSIPSKIAAKGLRQWERTLILIGYFLDDRTLPFFSLK